MCFTPAPKAPKVQATAIVPPPTPALDDPAGVKFGGEDEEYERGEKQDKGRLTEEEEDDEKNKLKGSKAVAANRRSKAIGRSIKSAAGGA